MAHFLRKATTTFTTSATIFTTITTSAASPLLSKLLLLRQTPNASTITHRFIRITTTNPTSTNIPVGGSSDDEEDDPELAKSTVGLLTFKGPPEFFEKYEHPFQCQGQRKALSVDETEEGMVVRVTMPGVEEEGCKILMKEKNVVEIFAEAVKRLEPGPELPRKYSLSLEFKPEMHRVEDLDANLKNGILKIFVPKVVKDGEVKDEDRKVVPYVFEAKEEEEKNQDDC